MKRVFEYDDASAVEAALRCLRQYNHAMWISVDEEHLDKELAERYFRAEENSEDEINLEKQIGAAAICSCNDNPDIPQKYKVKVANRMYREFLGAFRASKVDFMYSCGKFGMPNLPEAEKERERKHKEIAIVNKVRYLNNVTKIIRRRSKRIIQYEGLKKIFHTITDSEPTIKLTSRIIMFASGFIPEKVKDSIKETADDAFEKTANILNKNVERIKQTEVGKKVTEVYENKIEPIVRVGYEKVAEVCSKVKHAAKSTWTKIKSFFA